MMPTSMKQTPTLLKGISFLKVGLSGSRRAGVKFNLSYEVATRRGIPTTRGTIS